MRSVGNNNQQVNRDGGMNTVYYPKRCFHINMDETRVAMREYEKKYKEFYKVLEEEYPDYYKMSFNKRRVPYEAIVKKLGYRPSV